MVIVHYAGFSSSVRQTISKRLHYNRRTFLVSRYLKQLGCNYAVVLKDTPYLDNGHFQYYYKVMNAQGWLKLINQPIKADVIFNKGGFADHPNCPKLVNSRQFLSVGGDKIRQAEVFKDLMPKTEVVYSYAQAVNYLRSRPKRLVVKPPNLNGGKGIQFVEKPQHLVVDDDHQPPFVIQDFIETDIGIPQLVSGRHDLRIYMLNKLPIYMSIRTPTGDKLAANTKQGGQISYYRADKIPTEVKRLCQIIDKRLKPYGRRFYSSDFVRDNQGAWWLLEINARPAMPTFDVNPEAEAVCRRIANFLLRAAVISRSPDNHIFYKYKQTRSIDQSARQTIAITPTRQLMRGVDTKQVNQDKQRLNRFKQDLDNIGQDLPQPIASALKQTYVDLADQAIASRQLLVSSQTTTSHFQPEQFRQANQLLYGQLDKQLWQASINSLLGDHRQANSWRRQLAITHKQPVKQKPPAKAKLAVIVKQLGLQQLIEMVENSSESNLANLNSLLLNFCNLPDWQAVTGPHQRQTKLVYGQRQLLVPRNIDKRSKLKLKRIAIHEIGIHLQRHLQAKITPIRAINFGLPGYRLFEEGLATVLTKHLTGQNQTKGVVAYAALGLALGLDGQPRNHRQTKQILKQLLELEQLTKKANLVATKVSRRIFHGSDLTTPGIVFLKDKIYLEGINLATDLINACGSDESVVKLIKYRYNPTADYQNQLIDWLTTGH